MNQSKIRKMILFKQKIEKEKRWNQNSIIPVEIMDYPSEIRIPDQNSEFSI